ncbi:flavin reductase family protein [Hirschia baltica]|uniref:Flavin reductase domain protein FMN-binding n=1 Tax=Hirschia baltica (strain ATCC 49814 / DSM 5838 / IFAM 1418) TaxID=582402 RepID=C6XR11_HIRBI|nr:flavin reductase family protein [Hirschia baltica]ACT60542.1 flavin reductase domain protein FMN-binding [Hirschia baltica ATCC 49814]
MDIFSPEENARAFRSALGSFSTGVTIVTTQSKDGPIGITANSFSSLSLNPALVMWAPAKQSSRYEAFINAEFFAIHVLTYEQKFVCDAFAKSKNKFEHCDYLLNEYNIPIINDCLSVFECKKHKIHDAGDHSIIIGEVLRARQKPGNALIFSQGSFISASAFQPD